MPVRAGDLLEAVLIEQRVITMNGGQAVTTWEEYSAEEPAQVEAISEMSYRFVIRYNPDIDGHKEDYRIAYNGKRWTIASAVPDPRKTMLVMQADTNLVEVTHILSTDREYIDSVPEVRPNS